MDNDHYNLYLATQRRENIFIEFGFVLRHGLSFGMIMTIINHLVHDSIPIEEFPNYTKSIAFWAELAVSALDHWYPFKPEQIARDNKRVDAPLPFMQAIRYRLVKLLDAARKGKVYATRDIISDCLLLSPIKRVAELEYAREQNCILPSLIAWNLFGHYFPQPSLHRYRSSYVLMGIQHCPDIVMSERMLGHCFSDADERWLNNLLQ